MIANSMFYGQNYKKEIQIIAFRQRWVCEFYTLSLMGFPFYWYETFFCSPYLINKSL